MALLLLRGIQRVDERKALVVFVAEGRIVWPFKVYFAGCAAAGSASSRCSADNVTYDAR